jgi:hypothetical protein
MKNFLFLRRMADYIPRDRVFEIIKKIETNINIYNERINEIINVLKHLKSNTKLAHTISNYNLMKKLTKAIDLTRINLDDSLNDSYKALLDQNEQKLIENKFNKLVLHDCHRRQLIDQNDHDDVKNKKTQYLIENQAKAKNFYNKLYDVLNKRQSLPKQFKPIFNLELSTKQKL